MKTTKPLIISIIVIALLNNLVHNAMVHQSINPASEQGGLHLLHSFVVVLVIDASILAFVINGQHRAALAFALILFFLNFMYWNGLEDVYHLDLNSSRSVGGVLLKLVFAGAFSYALHKFSTMYATIKQQEAIDKQTEKELLELNVKYKNVCDAANILKRDFKIQQEQIESSLNELNKIRPQSQLLSHLVQHFTCRCGFQSLSTHALVAHQKKCKQHKEHPLLPEVPAEELLKKINNSYEEK